jgi:threonine aldolase
MESEEGLLMSKRVSFENDYNTGCHPRILAALSKTNDERTTGYGLDRYSDEARGLIKDACRAPTADVHFLVGGTQVNLIVAAGALKPWQGVISAETGHVNVHEAGAIEATGHKVLVVESQDGLLSADAIDRYCQSYRDDPTAEHMVQPGMIYLSQTTELGTVYHLKELRAIRQVADRWGLTLFVDGARLASALAIEETEIDLPALAELADVFSIGGTKCGALFGEAVVIIKDSLKSDFRSLVKQRGGLLAKGRLLGVQFRELFRDGLYMEIGRHENDMAAALAAQFSVRDFEFYTPPTSNQLFVLMDESEEKYFSERAVFERIGKQKDGRRICRFVTSFSTEKTEIDALFAQ